MVTKVEGGQYMNVCREDGFVREQNTHMTRLHPVERRKTLFEKRPPPHGLRKQRWFPQQDLSLVAAGRLQDFLGGRVSGSDKKRRWLPLGGFRARAGLCCGCRHLAY